MKSIYHDVLMNSPREAWMKREESRRNKGNLLEKDMVRSGGCSFGKF